ncbi:MAG: VanZ family protein [Mogibacterium sp.]|nr:VanZ family protein [Mogibacterium sp.]
MRLLISIIIVVGLIIFLRLSYARKSVRTGLLAVYVIAVLAITLGTRKVNDVTHVIFDPFVVYERTIKSVLQGWRTGGWAEAWKHLGWYKGQLSSIGLNVLLFVPLGHLVPSIMMRFDRWWKVLLLGFMSSLLIETVQLITKLGWFDASDLLHNTLGALMGYWIYCKWSGARKRPRRT